VKNIFLGYFRLSMFTSIIFMIFGLLLFFNPGGIIGSISIIIGLFLSIIGITRIISYFNNRGLGQIDLISGLFFTISGILLITNTNIIATIVPIIIGVCMIMMGAKKLDISLNFKNSNIKGWSYMFIIAILSIVCGIIFIINPIKGAFLATKVLGLIIMVYSIIDIINGLIFKNSFNKVTKIINEIK